ncbi:Mechanosensitive ion channel protein 1 [Forsythia ovata]|uniref:Mechanosensitive ion channel protein 1 n=1 Tax=Forsythia ovata TaxID=205694 RepID=A0ABD1WTF4_9LAMI
MASIRISSLKSVCRSMKYANRLDTRPSIVFMCRNYPTRESGHAQNFVKHGFGTMGLNFASADQNSRGNYVNAYFSHRVFTNSSFRGGFSFAGISPMMYYRLFSSHMGSEGNIHRGPDLPAAVDASGSSSVSDGSIGGGDWLEKVKDAWQSTVDAVKYTGEKAKEVSGEATPYVQQLLDTHPYLRDIIVPVGGTLAGTLLAWAVLPKLLRRFYNLSMQGPAAFLAKSSLWGPVPYEKSFWGALEDPIRYLVTFMAFSQIGEMAAPTVITSQYVTQAWRGAVIVSLVWFLHRWKTNVIARALAVKSLEGVDRDRLLTLNNISSVGLFVVGLMALAEASGVAVQSILTVGGIGGVATAFASRDILGNVLSGLSVQLSHPFSVGDTIKAGSVEGQVVEMGLTTTSLLTAEKFPVIVPNSLFSSQVIVNKSRAQWRAMVTKIPLQIDDLEKIPQITEDIKTMLKSNSNVFLGKEAPYCFLSRIERSYAELTLGCNLKQMSKDAEQDILLQSVRIIKEHGAKLGSTQEDGVNQ